MFNSTKKINLFDSGNNNSLFGKGTIINGNISGDGDIRIDGTLHGDVNILGKLIVGESAIIKGDIKAERAEIFGSITGKISVKGVLSIKATGSVEGDLYVGQLEVEKSGLFRGTSHMVLPGQVVDINADQTEIPGNHSIASLAN
jgi:cytoskeletal protein CcmA (bactofilin family)